MSGPATGGIGPGTVEAYLDCLDRADQAAAVGLAAGLLDAGVPAAEVLVTWSPWRSGRSAGAG